MSATLRSFDVNDEGSIAFGKIPSPSLKSLHTRHQNSAESEKANFDDDIEFDDTRMDITDTTRSNALFRNENLFNRDIKNGGPVQHDYIIRNTTTKVPLNDSPHTGLASKVTKTLTERSTPLVSKINKHRSRNGTPLKLPPMSSNQFSSGSDDNNILPVEQKIEDSLIKHRKLISDDNKFSPGNSRISTRDFSLVNPNGHNLSSPTRAKTNKLNETAITPPSNLKVRPFIFGSSSEGQSSTQTRRNLALKHGTRTNVPNIHVEDIEFDSSDAEHEIIDQKKVTDKPKLRTSVADQLSDRPNGVSRHGSPTNEYRNDVGKLSKVPSINESYRKANSFGNDVKEGPVNEEISDQNEKYGDFSRAEILEKINNTINSLMEREKNASSPIKANVDQVLPDNIDGNLERDVSSDEAPDEILNELDSFFGGNKSSQQRYNSSVSNYPLKNENTNIPKAQSTKATPIRSHYSRLSGKYARQMVQRRKIGRDLTSNPQEKSINAEDLQTTEWPSSKWSKLNKVLQLEKLEVEDIINSEVLFRALGCTSKRELQQRVEFLIQFNKSRRIRKPHTAKKIKKNSIAPKLSKPDKRFQIL